MRHLAEDLLHVEGSSGPAGGCNASASGGGKARADPFLKSSISLPDMRELFLPSGGIELSSMRWISREPLISGHDQFPGAIDWSAWSRTSVSSKTPPSIRDGVAVLVQDLPARAPTGWRRQPHLGRCQLKRRSSNARPMTPTTTARASHSRRWRHFTPFCIGDCCGR